jgi:cell division protein FtsL
LLDRLVRGRAWIPVLGVLLAGIVATQVEVLKLGASMGRWMERSAALSSHNQSLQASVATLSDDQRIERLAARMGMVMPAPTAITFLPRHPAGGIGTALARIHPPDPAQFLATLQAQAALADASSPAPPPATITSSTGPASAPAGGTTSTSQASGG